MYFWHCVITPLVAVSHRLCIVWNWTLCFVFRTPLELHLTTSELWFGQEQEGILP